MPRPPFDHFRLIAPLYDRVFDDETVRRRMAAGLALPVAGWLLDVGGGTGRVAQTVSDQVGGIVVADVSQGMLRQARHKDGLRLTCAQAERLPFADGQFERILVVDAFHHFFHQEDAARELWRVLQPGGRLVIWEMDIARWSVRLLALGERLLLMRSRFFRAEELRGLFGGMENARAAVSADDDPLYFRLTAEKGLDA